MKKMMFTLIAMLTMTMSASAMSYEQARNEALFLTDKMAYELNLTDEQYEAAYEINLDYLMSVTGHSDVFGTYWERRNMDLSYILYSWQWDAFRAATYFYRPLYWDAGYWHFGIYARYPRRDYFYFGRPHFYVTYRGGHSWRMNNGRSFYVTRRDHFRSMPRDSHFGMRDGWNRGDFRGSRVHSSTRVTAGTHNHDFKNNRHNGTFRNDRSNGTFSGNRNTTTMPRNNEGTTSRSNGTFSGNRSNSSYSGGRSNGTFSGGRSNGTFSGGRSNGTFSGGRNTSSSSMSSPTRGASHSSGVSSSSRGSSSSGSSSHRGGISSGGRR